jgi:hypothetical protein
MFHRNRFLIASALCFFLALLCASGLSGATYYVNTNAAAGGNGTTTALTGANCAWDTIADVNAKVFAVGDFCLFSRGQTWAETLTPHDSGDGTGQITYGAYGTGAAPIISGAGSYSLNNAKSYVTFYGISFITKQTYVSAGDSVIFNYCSFLDHPTGSNVSIGGTGNTVKFNNCIFAGAYSDGLQTGGSTISTVTNCIFIGNGFNSRAAINNLSSGALTYDYCLIIGNNRYPGYNVQGAGTVDGGHNLLTVEPGITSYANGNGYFVFFNRRFHGHHFPERA